MKPHILLFLLLVITTCLCQNFDFDSTDDISLFNESNQSTHKVSLNSDFKQKKIKSVEKALRVNNCIYLFFSDPAAKVEIIISRTSILSYLPSNLADISSDTNYQTVKSSSTYPFNLFKFQLNMIYDRYAPSELYLYMRTYDSTDEVSLDLQLFYSSQQFYYLNDNSRTNANVNIHINKGQNSYILINTYSEIQGNTHFYFRGTNCSFQKKEISTSIANISYDNIFYNNFDESLDPIAGATISTKNYMVLKVSVTESTFCQGDLFISNDNTPDTLDIATPIFIAIIENKTKSFTIQSSYEGIQKKLNLAAISSSFKYKRDIDQDSSVLEKASISVNVDSASKIDIITDSTMSFGYALLELAAIVDLSTKESLKFDFPSMKCSIFIFSLTSSSYKQIAIDLLGKKEITKLYFKSELNPALENSNSILSFPFINDSSTKSNIAGIAVNKLYMTFENIKDNKAYGTLIAFYSNDIDVQLRKECQIYQANIEVSVSIMNGKGCVSFDYSGSQTNEMDLMFNMYTELSDFYYYSPQMDILSVKAEKFNFKLLNDFYSLQSLPRVYFTSTTNLEIKLIFSFYVSSTASLADTDASKKPNSSYSFVNNFVKWSKPLNPNFEFFVYADTTANSLKEQSLYFLLRNELFARIVKNYYTFPEAFISSPNKRVYLYTINKVSGLILKIVSFYNTNTTRVEDCVDSQNNEIKYATSLTTLKLSNGVCASSCLQNIECYDSQFICKKLGEGFLLGALNQACIKECDTNECFSKSTFVCQTPTTNNVSNQNGLVCSAMCNDKNKCFNSSYICQNAESGQLANQDGGQCLNYCDKNKCFDPKTFLCIYPNSNAIINEGGKSCELSCLTKTKCYNSSSFICQDPSAGILSNGDGGICSSSCIDKKKCINSKFACVFPSKGEVNDNGYCRAKCSDLNQCSNSEFICVKPTLSMLSKSDGGPCLIKCKDKSQCISNNNVCQKPQVNQVSNNDGGLCTKDCLSGSECWNPLTFICEPNKNPKARDGGECRTCNCKDGPTALSKCNPNDAQNIRIVSNLRSFIKLS